MTVRHPKRMWKVVSNAKTIRWGDKRSHIYFKEDWAQDRVRWLESRDGVEPTVYEYEVGPAKVVEL